MAKRKPYGVFDNEEKIFPGAKQIYFDWYLENKKTPCTFDGKQAGCLDKLIRKIIFKLAAHEKEINYENILDLFIIILNDLRSEKKNRTVVWVYENIEISLLSSKFDIVFINGFKKTSAFKEEKTGGSSTGTASGDQDVDNLFRGR